MQEQCVAKMLFYIVKCGISLKVIGFSRYLYLLHKWHSVFFMFPLTHCKIKVIFPLILHSIPLNIVERDALGVGVFF